MITSTKATAGESGRRVRHFDGRRAGRLPGGGVGGSPAAVVADTSWLTGRPPLAGPALMTAPPRGVGAPGRLPPPIGVLTWSRDGVVGGGAREAAGAGQDPPAPAVGHPRVRCRRRPRNAGPGAAGRHGRSGPGLPR